MLLQMLEHPLNTNQVSEESQLLLMALEHLNM